MGTHGLTANQWQSHGTGVGRRQWFGWLVIVMLLMALLVRPGSAHASAGFTFVPDPSQPSLPAGSALVDVADLTGSGIPDVVVKNTQNDTLGVMLGNGAGGFGPASSIPLGARPTWTEVADFNDDGHPDLLVGLETKSQPRELNPVPEAVEILSGDGNGNFTVGPQVRLPEQGNVQVGDFTAEGNADVVVVPSSCELGIDNSKLYMLVGDGHGDLTPGPTTADETPGCSYQVGDFTGDRRDDLLTQHETSQGEGTIVVLPSEPDGSFGAPIATPTPEFAPYAAFVGAAGDLYGNGKLDLVVRALKGSVGQVVVMDGNGAGGFTVGGFYPLEQPSTYDFDVALGAFAGDGHLDIAAIGSAGSPLTVLTNSGNDLFSPVLTPPLGASVGEAFVADVNGDGRPDIILGVQSELHVFLDEPASPSSVPSRPLTKLATPSVQKLSESAKQWREGSRLAHLSRKDGPPVGTTFFLLLNEPATASFGFTEELTGRSVRGRCVAETGKNRDAKSCKRKVKAGALSLRAHTGTNKIAFEGRISRSKRLKPGPYTLTVGAKNSAGVSRTKQLTFTIVK